MRDRILSFLGIAEKAGRLSCGNFAADEAVKSGKASLVIISTDAQKNTSKGFRDACAFYKVPLRCYATRGELGAAVGMRERTVIAVTDRGFADRLLAMLDESGGESFAPGDSPAGACSTTGADVDPWRRKNKRGCNGKNKDQ